VIGERVERVDCGLEDIVAKVPDRVGSLDTDVGDEDGVIGFVFGLVGGDGEVVDVVEEEVPGDVRLVLATVEDDGAKLLENDTTEFPTLGNLAAMTFWLVTAAVRVLFR